MGTFDDFKEKLASVGKAAAEGARDLAEKARLTAGIADRERKIEKLYEQLGRTFYEDHRDAPEEPYAETVRSINGYQDEIREFRKRIEELKDDDGNGTPEDAPCRSGCGGAAPSPEDS